MAPIPVRITAVLLSLISQESSRQAKLREFQMTEGQYIPHWPDLLIAELDGQETAIASVRAFYEKGASA